MVMLFIFRSWIHGMDDIDDDNDDDKTKMYLVLDDVEWTGEYWIKTGIISILPTAPRSCFPLLLNHPLYPSYSIPFSFSCGATFGNSAMYWLDLLIFFYVMI